MWVLWLSREAFPVISRTSEHTYSIAALMKVAAQSVHELLV